MRIRVCPKSLFPQADFQHSSIQVLQLETLPHHLRPGDGMLIYVPDSTHTECTVVAVCEVIGADPEHDTMSLDIRPIVGVIRPDSRARYRWASNPYLCLDKSKVIKYGLLEYFCAIFSPDKWTEDRLEDCVNHIFRPDLSKPTLIPKEGLIYLLRGKSLHKIGKTIDLARRKKEIENQVEEELEIIHTIASNDIMRAEALLHQKYSAQRKWGEWFDLTADQVDDIRSIGRMEF